MRQRSPSTARNREPILEVLQTVVPPRGFVLETSAGSGEHSVFFAAAFPELTWQPTDVSEQALASISAWRADANLPNLLPPEPLDVRDSRWAAVPESGADVVLSINMIHISPWEAAVGLFEGAGRALLPGGVLVTYGPYLVDGAFTSPSNRQFEDWLKGLDPAYGQRDLEALRELAEANGLTRDAVVPMPANNFTVVYRKT